MTVDLKTIGQLATMFGAGASGMYYAQKLRRNRKSPGPDPPRSGERTDILIALGRIENRQISQDGKMERLDGKIQGLQDQMDDLRSDVNSRYTQLDGRVRLIEIHQQKAAGSAT